MKIESICSTDLALFEAMFCDPLYMSQLGGVHSKEEVIALLNKQVSHVEKGTAWVYKLVPTVDDVRENEITDDPSMQLGVGTVCIWTGYCEEEDREVTEFGWGVMTKYQGRGFATKGVQLVLDLVRQSNNRWGTIHAFTTVTNVPSNSLCARLGFSLVGESNIDYNGRSLRANHYQLDSSC